MNSAFKSIASLTVSHSYFRDDCCTDLIFTPDKETTELIKKYNFLINPASNGVSIYCGSHQKIGDLFDYIERATGRDYFSFSLTTENSDFYIYSNLPNDWLGTILYTNQVVEDQQTLILKPDYDHQGSKIVAEIKLYFDQIVSDENPNYSIVFKSRDTRWNYYIINRGELILKSPSIEAKEGTPFISGGNVTLPTGEKALQFLSEGLIPLQEIPSNVYSLVEGNKANNKYKKILIRGLPNAVPSGTVNVSGQQNEFASYMYVYL